MLFLNPWLLAGLAGAAIPIIIHLVRQQAAKPIEWGAMRFLFDTISVRRRKMEWEDLLLMAARCLLLALLALALARPFVPPDSRVPWLSVLPAALVGIALCGGSFVLAGRRARWLVRGTGLALLLAAASLVWFEKYLNLKRFEASGRRDVALVIDASASMELARDGKTVFTRAVEEAKDLVREAPAGTAFSVVLGGPAPEAMTAAPLTHRADVLGVLDQLAPTGGSFRAHDALGMATLGLAEGTNASKEIVVFTDSQRSGWRFDNPPAWDGLAAAWKAMSSKPKLLLRDFGSPAEFRNIALADMEMSRSIVGTDRELALRVTVENTGTVPLTSGRVLLEIAGKEAGGQPVGLLAAGQSASVEFQHRFTREGPQVITARIDSTDDLASDNRLARVVLVRGTLPFLLVDGNPAGSFFERAAGYPALALAPSAALIGGKATSGEFLMDPRVVAANALREEDFENAGVIVLADVSRLPERIAAKLAGKVAAGAGLLVIAGPRSEPAFYNAWEGLDGPLLPVPLAGEAADVAGISPAPATFVHESLKLFENSGDLTTALVTRWRKTGKPFPGGIQAAAFTNGDAFLASRNYGSGRCMISTCAFDARAGNLPARKAFVPLVHELVNWVAGGGVQLNIGSAWSPAFALGATGGGGLSATYFRSRDKKEKPLLERIDPAIDFNWTKAKAAPQIPRDGFSVRWRGSIVAPATGNYLLEAEVDDRLEMTLGNNNRMEAAFQDPQLGRVALEVNKPVPVEINYDQDGGDAHVRLFWTPPNGKRQIIPSAAFVPIKSAPAVAMKAIDPVGLPREAWLRSSRRGQELAIGGRAVPGIYLVSTGSALDDLLPGPATGPLPFAVLRDPSESRFETMDDDRALVRKRIDLLEPRSVADLLGVLQGKGFGREIWKLLAAAAFLLFLLECVLARWVSRSRRVSEDARVEFGEATV